MRSLLVVSLCLLLAGCAAPPDPVEAPQVSEPRPEALEPLNATLAGTMEFAVSFESPVLEGCAGHNFSSALTTGNRLTLDVPRGYGNGSASAVVTSPSSLGSYRLCLNEQDGTNVATITGPSPLNMTFDPPTGKLFLFLWGDNTSPNSPAVEAQFTMTLTVTA